MARFILCDQGHLLGRLAATQVTELRTEAGHATGLTHGVLKAVSHLTRQLHCDFTQVISCWDGGRSKFRLDLYPEYKGNRKPKEETEADKIRYAEFKLQAKDVKFLLESLGIKQLYIPGVEADDLIGIVSKRLEDQDHEVVIFSGDHDMHQLASSKVKVIKPKEESPRNAKQILEAYELENVEQLILVKAIMGDSSDNIHGVPGIGEKRAKLVWPWVSAAINCLRPEECPPIPEKIKKYVDLALTNLDIIKRNIQLIRIPRYLTGSNFTEEQMILFEQSLSTTPKADKMKFLAKCRDLELNEILGQIGRFL